MGQLLLLDPSSLEPWQGNPLVGVAGHPLEVWGCAKVEIEIAGEKFRPTMVVTSALTTEAILGGDFLRENYCTLEMGKRILRFINRVTLNRASNQ